MTQLQKMTAQAIVNVFETGRPLGDYGSVTVLKGDTGHLTYGRSQTTLGSGNLACLIKAYCDADGALLAGDLRAYLERLEDRDASLDSDEKVKHLLRQAGSDPAMKKVQDDFFDRNYWEPAIVSAKNAAIALPLGITAVYDSKIQGSFEVIRGRVNFRYGTRTSISEQEWIRAYVTERSDWLSNHPNALLHQTVYRMDAFKEMIGDGKWDLALPITVRGVVINADTFAAPPERAAGRTLEMTEPPMRGDDVKAAQKALGFPDGKIDGIFGKDTDRAVRSFQSANGLSADGRIGPETRKRLRLSD